MKKAFITGITGQDGALLAKQLLNDGLEVIGGYRKGSADKTWHLDHAGITQKIKLVECHLDVNQDLTDLIKEVAPDEIYNLAGESSVADSFKHPSLTMMTNTQGVVGLLEAVRQVTPETRLITATSSEIFGHSNTSEPITEQSEKNPSNPYGISKLAALHLVRMYREHYKMHCCSGILFNHESPYRALQYVTRKITFNLARLKHEGGDPIQLGDLNASRDWGAADDYVKAMQLMLRLENPEDLVVASGRLTKVREFFRIAGSCAGFDPVFEGEGVNETCRDGKSGLLLAKVSPDFFRPNDTRSMGNPAKLKSLTNWQGSRPLEQLVEEMVKVDMDRWSRGDTEH